MAEKRITNDVKMLGGEPDTSTTGSLRQIAPLTVDGDLTDDYKALERRVTRKIDMRVVPMLCALYLSAYLDRTNVSFHLVPL